MAKSVAFNKLNGLTMAKRLQIARDPTQGPLILSMLTPTDFADLFPKYYQHSLPDVSGFRAAITKKSQEQQQQYFDSIDEKIGTASPATAERIAKEGTTGRGGRSGSAGDSGARGGSTTAAATSGGKINNPVMVKQIYDYLMTKPDMDHAHAIGIINNMKHESKFNSGAFNKNDVNGPSGGLFQHHDNYNTGERRFSNMVEFAGKDGQDWKTNWKGQIDFALTERDMKNYLSTKYGDESAASMGFTRQFERPRNTESVAFDRAQTAMQYSNFIKSGGSSEQGTTPSTTGGGTSTDKWNSVRPLSGGSAGMCARGVHGLAKQIFAGNSFWDKRPGYSSPSGINMASDVAYGKNNIFQQSGMYHPGQRVDRQALTQEYLNSLPDGTIIAAGGGRSDGAGHIQMKVGGRWVSDFPQSGFLYQRNAQQPYKDFTVLSLTDQGKSQLAQNGYYIPGANEAKQIAQSPPTEQVPTVAVAAEQEEVRVNPLPTEEEFKLEQQQEALKQKADTTNLPPEDKKKADELAAKDPSKLSVADKTILEQTSPPNAIVDKSAPISPSATPAPAVAPVNSGPQIGRFKVDPEAFREASKPGAAREGYAGWMVNMASHQDLIDGFNKNKDAIAAGAHISNDWVLTVKNKNDPKVKAILEEYKGNVLKEIQDKQAMREDATVTTKLATAVQAINPVQPAVAGELNMNDPEVRRKIEEEHKANIEKQKAQSASLPEGKSSSAGPAKTPETKPGTPAETAKTVTPTATVNPPASAKVATAEDIKAMGIMMPKVPGASTGGSFDVGGQPVSFYPMDKRDNIAAINPITQQPLFTAQSGERIQVNPNQRSNNIDQQPQNPVMNEINNIYNMMQEGFTQAGSIAQDTATQRLPQDRPDDNPTMIGQLNKLTTMPLPAPLERAMRRTGAGTFDHFGYGNKS